MKPFTLTTISLLCATISPLCADTPANKSAKATSTQPTQPMNQITPSANPMVTHCVDPYVTADFIWWKPQEDGLIFAYSGAEPLVPAVPPVNVSKGHIFQPAFKYEPGFKVGFGLKFKHDGWDLYANYTWLHSNFDDTKKTAHAPTGSGLQSNTFVFGLEGPVAVQINDQAKAQWSLHFNVVDLELGRNYWISQWLTLRPHFGMKFSWIDQDFNVKYENLRSIDDSSLNGANVKIHNDLDQWGVGLRTGLDTAWYLWRKWCIFGDFAISGMWNDFDVKRKDRTSFASSQSIPVPTTATTLYTSHNPHSVTAVIELALGLRFETTFYNDDYLFMLQAGWEEQIWFNQNQFFNPLTSTPEDLTFEGLTVKAGFAF